MSLCTIIHIFSSVKRILEKMHNIIISAMDYFFHPSVPISSHSTPSGSFLVNLALCMCDEYGK